MQTPKRSEYWLISHLVRCGEAAASLAGHRCITEWSPASESVYLHIERRGIWFGVRIAAHAPAYDCSRDYACVLVPRYSTSDTQVVDLTRTVLTHVRCGGSVVADPRDVWRATRRLNGFLQTGRKYVDRNGNRWVWSADEGQWNCVDRGSRNAGFPEPPVHRPAPLMSNRLRSSVRHSQNMLAKWASELSSAAETGS
ncbi:MAG: hypothetical protein AAGF31_04345 [Planctomycetota bacterium]